MAATLERKRPKMQPRKIFVSSIFITILTFVLLLIVTGFIPPGVDRPQALASTQGAAPVESPEIQVNLKALTTSAPEPVASLEISIQDGQSLLEAHCSQCHLTHSLDQVEKSRGEWEMDLKKMETFGVRLGDSEKTILLDYLTDGNKQ
jgi:hypothetical protein